MERSPSLRQPLSLTRAGGNVELTWTTMSNATYRVQYNSNVASADWIDLPGDLVANSGTASKTDVLTATNRYYRVRLLP